jgi:hypothetical protein
MSEDCVSSLNVLYYCLSLRDLRWQHASLIVAAAGGLDLLTGSGGFSYSCRREGTHFVALSGLYEPRLIGLPGA